MPQTFTGIEYIKIDLANQFGLDRLKWNERLWWVDDHRPDLDELQSSAKNKIAFGKAKRALIKAEQLMPINHILNLDATASGLQAMGAMSGCRLTAKAVNMIDTGNRECVYAHAGGAMSGLLGMDIARDTIKKPLMTFFYGSMAVPKQIFGEGDGLTAFFGALKAQLPGPFELMQLFQSFWDPTATKYTWAMPDGHVVHIPVSVKEERGLEIDGAGEGGKNLRFQYRAEVIAPRPKGLSLAANIVHSVDGWMARQMVIRAKDMGFYLAPIHDCFYAHPNYMNQVRQLYRDVLSEVADMNLVSAILSQIAGRTVAYTPNGASLRLEIQKSEYALS